MTDLEKTVRRRTRFPFTHYRQLMKWHVEAKQRETRRTA